MNVRRPESRKVSGKISDFRETRVGGKGQKSVRKEESTDGVRRSSKKYI